MDQLFPLSSPFFQLILFPSFLRRPSNSSEEAGGREGGAKEGEKKRETETRNCRTTYHHGAPCTIHSVNGVASPIIDSFLWTWDVLTRSASLSKFSALIHSESTDFWIHWYTNCFRIQQFIFTSILVHEYAIDFDDVLKFRECKNGEREEWPVANLYR